MLDIGAVAGTTAQHEGIYGISQPRGAGANLGDCRKRDERAKQHDGKFLRKSMQRECPGHGVSYDHRPVTASRGGASFGDLPGANPHLRDEGAQTGRLDRLVEHMHICLLRALSRFL